MTNDNEAATKVEGGSPLPLVVALILGLFLAAYLVRANPSSPGPSGLTSPSSSTEDIMPAAFKKYLPWDPNGKDVKSGNLGLQYIVLKEGPKDGKKPVPTDLVTVHYEGRLATGEKFDSSLDRGDPATFPQTFPALTAAEGKRLQLLWISCGTEDRLIEANRQVRAFLTDRGVPHEAIEMPGAHTWTVWRRNLAAFTPKLFR